MTASRDRRGMRRTEWESWVTVKDPESNQFHTGRLYNFHSEGIYFECDAAFESGKALTVMIEKTPDTMRPEVLRAEVKWTEEIVAPVVMFHYGVGASFATQSDQPEPMKGLKVIHGGSEVV